ncbi:NUDIX hydrolase [Rhodococcus sp. SGAir0479]|uniref:NUDIX hydrolase n=1 Tax=Rhodococcus sp. SGAir0479 TaxID=2567884 RepID=UPI0010CD36C3|nr:NUDIX hydrolase [Rhodococcus sp. SGAir0479]QCQ92448.1 NUDIX hydrolase [Rhodococcus sp. SGAir0479]
MRGDGDGWSTTPDGVRHWGRHGAAGLLLRAPLPDGSAAVLLQHRAAWSHQGGTWALPGGARDSHETTVHAAVREAQEETGIDVDAVQVRAERVTSSVAGGWTYTTVVADAEKILALVPNGESTELRWVPEADVAHMPLHPGFAAAWPGLRTTEVRVLLDTANVLGSRPTGWWRDRAGATTELLDRLAQVLPRTIELPDGGFGWLPRVEAVLEGRARDAGHRDARVPVHAADGSGDDELARLAAHAGALTAVVTADRGLRGRLPDSVLALSPSTVLGWLD